MCFTGPAGGAGGGSFAEGEGGRGGEAGSPAGQERERDPEEGHQEREAETQDYLQGSFFYRMTASNLKCFSDLLQSMMFSDSTELELLC